MCRNLRTQEVERKTQLARRTAREGSRRARCVRRTGELQKNTPGGREERVRCSRDVKPGRKPARGEGRELGSGEPYSGWAKSPKRTERRKLEKLSWNLCCQLGGASSRIGGALEGAFNPVEGAFNRSVLTVCVADKVLSVDRAGGALNLVGGALDPRDRLSRSYIKAPGVRNSITTQAINL